MSSSVSPLHSMHLFSYLLQEMLKNLVEVIKNPFGRKVILYLLRPRDPMHFHPDVVKILAQGDGNAHR